MNHHFSDDSRTLYHTAVRGQIPFQDCQSPCNGIRILQRADHLRIFIHGICNILSDGLSGDGHASRI